MGVSQAGSCPPQVQVGVGAESHPGLLGPAAHRAPCRTPEAPTTRTNQGSPLLLNLRPQLAPHRKGPGLLCCLKGLMRSRSAGEFSIRGLVEGLTHVWDAHVVIKAYPNHAHDLISHSARPSQEL